MSVTLTPPLPAPALPAPHSTPPPAVAAPVPGLTRAPYHFTVAQYQRMIAADVLTADDKVELLEGLVVQKMSRNPPHDAAISILDEYLRAFLPPGWCLRTQLGLALTDSQPEPDFLFARGRCRDFIPRHPTAADAYLVIEVADSSRLYDRRDKARLYARAAIPVYWIVNLVDRRVEVLTDPSGPTAVPAYATAAAFAPGADVPLLLPGSPPAVVPAAELLL
jgi:Uma2 family endonuclease